MFNRFLGIGPDNIGDDVLVKIGQVVGDLDDEYGGLRIKVKIDQDKGLDDKDIPFSFPLLPKTIQSVPKKGEAVFVLLSRFGNKNSNRYYLGPIISQPQYFYKEDYRNGTGTSTSLIKGGLCEPLETINHYNETNGSFPKVNDVALIGRKSEDIILKDGEIDIRCGIRASKFENSNEKDELKGNVIFNSLDPAYIQLKYSRGLGKNMNSVINLVADKINLISHQNNNGFNLTDQQNLINSKELGDIMGKLYSVPYGEEVVEVLKKIILALTNHVHAYPGLPPIPSVDVKSLWGIDFEKLLSKDIRIS